MEALLRERRDRMCFSLEFAKFLLTIEYDFFKEKFVFSIFGSIFVFFNFFNLKNHFKINVSESDFPETSLNGRLSP